MQLSSLADNNRPRQTIALLPPQTPQEKNPAYPVPCPRGLTRTHDNIYNVL